MQHPSTIARLPRPILEELNRRLDRAQPGKLILEWVKVETKP